MPEKYFLTILALNWNQRLGHTKTKLNICHHMLMSSTQLQNWSFHVVERTRTSIKCQKMKNARAKRAKNTGFLYLWVFVAVVVAVALPKGGFPLSRNFYVRTDVNLNWLYVRKLK